MLACACECVLRICQIICNHFMPDVERIRLDTRPAGNTYPSIYVKSEMNILIL